MLKARKWLEDRGIEVFQLGTPKNCLQSVSDSPHGTFNSNAVNMIPKGVKVVLGRGRREVRP